MCLGRAYLNIEASLGGDGFPLPRVIKLPDGRQLDAAMMAVAPITTARGVESYRYELWVAGEMHVIYLQNSLPLRWYVEVELPFRTDEPAAPPLAAVAG